jgi:hypothetical protein
VRKAHYLTAFCEPIVYTNWDLQHLETLQASTISLTDAHTAVASDNFGKQAVGQINVGHPIILWEWDSNSAGTVMEAEWRSPELWLINSHGERESDS